MDNRLQCLEIQKFQQRLSRLLGRTIDRNVAATIWVRKYAKIWRLKHCQRQSLYLSP